MANDCEKAVKDLAGKRFGRLVALEPTDRRSGSNVVWLCRCDCGRMCEVDRQNLRRGTIKSCGCLRSDLAASRRAARADYTDGTCMGLLTQKTRSNNTSGIKGVHFDKSRGKWEARITFKGKTRVLGRFATIQEAAEARREAEQDTFDPFLEAHGKPCTSEEAYQERLQGAVARMKGAQQ